MFLDQKYLYFGGNSFSGVGGYPLPCFADNIFGKQLSADLGGTFTPH